MTLLSDTWFVNIFSYPLSGLTSSPLVWTVWNEIGAPENLCNEQLQPDSVLEQTEDLAWEFTLWHKIESLTAFEQLTGRGDWVSTPRLLLLLILSIFLSINVIQSLGYATEFHFCEVLLFTGCFLGLLSCHLLGECPSWPGLVWQQGTSAHSDFCQFWQCCLSPSPHILGTDHSVAVGGCTNTFSKTGEWLVSLFHRHIFFKRQSICCLNVDNAITPLLQLRERHLECRLLAASMVWVWCEYVPQKVMCWRLGPWGGDTRGRQSGRGS